MRERSEWKGAVVGRRVVGVGGEGRGEGEDGGAERRRWVVGGTFAGGQGFAFGRVPRIPQRRACRDPSKYT